MYIEAGDMKGRKILAPPGEAMTRPITGRVRKSVFGIIQDWLPEAVVLDLYCGTGTLGLEAISRGATLCCFAERDRRVVDRLKRNIRDCRVEGRAEVWAGDIETQLPGWLGEVTRPVDLVFLDPPFPHAQRWDWSRQERTMFNPLAGALAEDGLVVLRLPDDVDPPEALGELVGKRVEEYGNMKVLFYALNRSE